MLRHIGRVLTAILVVGSGHSTSIPASEPNPELGRELFERVWSAGDSRSHQGDGLGPVFNAKSCADCHNVGGLGGAGSFGRNVDIISARSVTSAMSNGFFAYSYSFSFGPNGFQQSFGNSDVNRNAAEERMDPTALAAIHPSLKAGKPTMLHQSSTERDYPRFRATVPGLHGSIFVDISQRNPTSLFGTGLIDMIPDRVIEEGAGKRHPGFEQVRGRVRRLSEGKVGRFGWKAQSPSLDDFVRGAAANEMGLEVPGKHQQTDPRFAQVNQVGLDMTEAETATLVEFVRALPAPTTQEPIDGNNVDSEMKAGKRILRAAGCLTCHVQKLGNVDGIYSDLLLHDMTPSMTNPYAAFFGGIPAQVNQRQTGRELRPFQAGEEPAMFEWRTPPLWGLRDSAPYWHDGRAETVDQAIRFHDGQGAESAARYANFTSRERAQLQAFLLSLTAPRLSDMQVQPVAGNP